MRTSLAPDAWLVWLRPRHSNQGAVTIQRGLIALAGALTRVGVRLPGVPAEASAADGACCPRSARPCLDRLTTLGCPGLRRGRAEREQQQSAPVRANRRAMSASPSCLLPRACSINPRSPGPTSLRPRPLDPPGTASSSSTARAARQNMAYVWAHYTRLGQRLLPLMRLRLDLHYACGHTNYSEHCRCVCPAHSGFFRCGLLPRTLLTASDQKQTAHDEAHRYFRLSICMRARCETQQVAPRRDPFRGRSEVC